MPTGARPHLPAVSDTVDVVLPGHQLFRDELAAGHLADWNPLVSGGTAFGSGTGVGFYSPLNLPYLLLPTWLAPAYVKLLEMAVAIGGMVLFLRRLDLARAAAVLGGILFASSGFMVTWTNWPHTGVAALIPALFWVTERFAQRRTVRAAVPVAVVVALMLLGGFPAVTGYAVYAAAPYLLLRLAQLTGRRPWPVLRGAATAGGALALGAGAVAVVLLPFLAQLRELDYLADRAQRPGEHLPPDMLLTAAVWRGFGTEAGGDGYWGPISSIEGLSFVGAGALVLVGFGLLRPPGAPRGVRAYFAVAALVAVVLGYVGGPLLALAQQLPVFSDNPVYRIRSVLGFFVAVLAAIGFDALLRPAVRRGRARVLAEAAGWLLAAVAAYLAARYLLHTGYRAGHPAYVKRQILLAALPAGLVLSAGLAASVLRWAGPLGRAGGGAGGDRGGVPVAAGALLAADAAGGLLPGHRRAPVPGRPPGPGPVRREGPDPAVRHQRGVRPAQRDRARVHRRGVARPAARGRPGGVPDAGFSRFSGHTGGATLRSPVLDLLAVRYFAFAPLDPVIGVPAAVGAPGAGLLEPGKPVVVPLGAGGVRGAGPRVLREARPRDPYARIDVEILDRRGTVVARNSRRLYDRVRAERLIVPLAGEALTGPLSARLTLHSDGPLTVAGGSSPQLELVRPDPADRLRLVYAADGAVLYRRETALPRVRWADHAVVVPDAAARVRLLAGTRDPGRVVLAAPGPAAADGRPAAVSVLADGTDGSLTRVRAAGAGYLVVADAVQDGWQATVDGRPAPLLAADHALVAVPVPAGEHEVRLRYVPPGRRTGAGGQPGLAGAAGRRRGRADRAAPPPGGGGVTGPRRARGSNLSGPGGTSPRRPVLCPTSRGRALAAREHHPQRRPGPRTHPPRDPTDSTTPSPSMRSGAGRPATFAGRPGACGAGGGHSRRRCGWSSSCTPCCCCSPPCSSRTIAGRTSRCTST